MLPGSQPVQRVDMITMKSFGVLICTLAALAAPEADSLTVRRGLTVSSFSSSSSSESSGQRDDCYSPRGLYRGEVSKSESGLTCLEWRTFTRRRIFIRRLQRSSDVNAGRHNFCRNFDDIRRFFVPSIRNGDSYVRGFPRRIHNSRRPWCYVRKNRQLVREYCRIPRCRFNSQMTCGQRTRRKQMKIVGGTVATVESHPWVAAIFWRSKSREKVFRCGGSLISACWVLTAAHCLPEGSRTQQHRLSVTLGKNALNESNPDVEQTFRVEEVIVHAGYNNSEGNFTNDIALLKLKAKHGKCAEESSSVKTVCLPPPQQSLLPGVTCEIAGYGKKKHSLWYKSQYLREAKVNFLADDVCRREDYYGNITDNTFCASRPDWSRDACKGHLGGPLVCKVNNRFFQFGVISGGNGCAKDLRPSVYTRVTNYNRWIEEKTGLSSITDGSMFPEK